MSNNTFERTVNIVGRVWPRHEQRGRPLSAIVRCRDVNRLLFAALTAASLSANAQYMANDPPGEMGCLGLLRALPARQIPDMKPYYDNIREGSGKEMAEKLHSLADSGNKDAQFTLSILFLTGRCVPQDICAARKYRERSRGSANDWEKKYPIPKEFEKAEADTVCN